MGFTESVQTVLTQKYATFSGRASRSEFWWFQLFYWLVLIALGIVALTAGATDDLDTSSPLVTGIAGIAGLFVLGMILPQISLQVRRFHDRNISGWWYLALVVLGAVPYLGLIPCLAITVISVLKGTEGPNRFGPDPLNIWRAGAFA